MKGGFLNLVVVSAIILGVILLFSNLNCSKDKKHEIIQEFITGKTDTIFISGKPDTVIKYVTKEINVVFYDTLRHDSNKTFSQIDTTFLFNEGAVKLDLAAYPAIDSLKIKLTPLFKVREIYRTDTLFLSKMDTLKIKETISRESNFFTGVGVGAAAVLLGVLLLQ
ncbi:MAG: hypothetical protein IAE91_07775 [Ignavibacteriaceae bacterium]|nr:hypothetical protein [Ignavibacteriaceae bacterium]